MHKETPRRRLHRHTPAVGFVRLTVEAIFALAGHPKIKSLGSNGCLFVGMVFVSDYSGEEYYIRSDISLPNTQPLWECGLH